MGPHITKAPSLAKPKVLQSANRLKNEGDQMDALERVLEATTRIELVYTVLQTVA